MFLENNKTRNGEKLQVLMINFFFNLRQRNIKYLT